MIEFNGIDETTYGLTVKSIKKSLMADVENRFVRKTAGDGSFDFGSFFGNFILEIEFQDKTSTTRAELYQNMLNISAWLYPLDKQSKILTLTGECGEGGLYHIAKLDGATELETILEYGKFTAFFVCTDPYKKALTKGFGTGVNFSRASTAYNDAGIVGINVLRYYLKGAEYGVLIEEGVTNFVFNPLFATPTIGIPSQYSARVLNSTGTHDTTAGKYTATMLTSTVNGAYFGIYEPGGAQHLIPLTTDRISGGVYTRVVSGTVLSKMQWNFLDTTFAPLPALTVTTASTTTIRLVNLNQNQATQGVIGIDLTAYAVTAGDVGVVEFTKPMLEFNGTYLHTFQDKTTARVGEVMQVAVANTLAPTSPFALALTIFPLWAKTDLQGDTIDRVVVELWEDATNYIRINWNSATEQFVASVTIGGASITASAPVTAFTLNDEIKLYLLKEATQFKLYIRVNAGTIFDSGYVADVRANPAISTIYVGSEPTNVKYINAVVKDLLFDDENAPTPLTYL